MCWGYSMTLARREDWDDNVERTGFKGLSGCSALWVIKSVMSRVKSSPTPMMFLSSASEGSNGADVLSNAVRSVTLDERQALTKHQRRLTAYIPIDDPHSNECAGSRHEYRCPLHILSEDIFRSFGVFRRVGQLARSTFSPCTRFRPRESEITTEVVVIERRRSP